MKAKMYFVMLVFAVFMLLSCGSETIIEDATMTSDSSRIANTNLESNKIEQEAKPPPPPPVDEEKKKNEKKFSEQSPFVNLGCCAEESKRKTACCCEAVLEKYTAMSNDKDPKLADYKMKDPLLGNCRRTMYKAFDLVDHPEPAKAEEANFDDLF